MPEVTQILHQIQEGNVAAASELLPLVYAELRRLARYRMRKEQQGQTLNPTALVQEAYIRLVEDDAVNWDGRLHFQEMNPLGSQLLLDGVSPLAFKVTTLAVSVLLLFVLRRYRGAQLASWWMCMVCTLLTFRWIVLDSAILS